MLVWVVSYFVDPLDLVFLGLVCKDLNAFVLEGALWEAALLNAFPGVKFPLFTILIQYHSVLWRSKRKGAAVL